MQQELELAPAGSTGNNTHAAARVGGHEAVALVFNITAVGSTPTVTFKFQGSHDGTNWYDVAYVTDASDTLSVATRVVTAVGQYTNFVANPVARRYRYFRLVTTANTNVTYNGKAYKYKSDD